MDNLFSDLPWNFSEVLDDWNYDRNHVKYGEWIFYWCPTDYLIVGRKWSW